MLVGVAVGMGMVGLDEIIESGTALKQRGYRRVNPHFIPKILINMAAGHISLKYGLQVQRCLLNTFQCMCCRVFLIFA